jgi:hypothetical protein
MKKHLSKKRVVLAAIIAVALAIASGVAYAYWTSSGNGTGSAAASSSSNLTVAQVGSVSGLVPGGPAQDVTIRVTNPATFQQALTAVAVTVSSASGSCNAAWFTPTSPTIGSPIPIAAAASTDVVGKIQMIESGSNQDSCKNATINLAFAAS